MHSGGIPILRGSTFPGKASEHAVQLPPMRLRPSAGISLHWMLSNFPLLAAAGSLHILVVTSADFDVMFQSGTSPACC